MISYLDEFNGWFGKIADDFNYENIFKLSTQLAKYYKANSTTGQKLIIGYDNKLLSKKFAEYISSIMAENGVKVFFGNKPSPTPALVISSLHKKSMGAISITSDAFNYDELGIKAFDNKGFPLKDEKLINFEELKSVKKNNANNFKKWISKGNIEPFDPSICYFQHIEKAINFNSMISLNRVMFNPNHGSSINYFDSFLNEKGLHGYTIDNDIKYNLETIDIKSTSNISKLYDDMVFHGTELGFSLSPDCSSFAFLIEPHHLTPKETLLLLLDSFKEKNKLGKILLSNNLDVKIPDSYIGQFDVEYISDDKFIEKLKEEKFVIAIDNLERFYFETHGVPDALLCGFYLTEIFNNKEMTPKLLHQKLNKIKGVL